MLYAMKLNKGDGEYVFCEKKKFTGETFVGQVEEIKEIFRFEKIKIIETDNSILKEKGLLS